MLGNWASEAALPVWDIGKGVLVSSYELVPKTGEPASHVGKALLSVMARATLGVVRCRFALVPNR